MDKEAQHRSLWNKIRENVDVFQGFNALVSPIYRQHLEELANIDEYFRQNALNGGIDSIRNALHEARMSFKRREYPQAIAYSHNVLQIIRDIFNPEMIKNLKDMQNEAIKDFYAERNNPEDLARVNEDYEKFVKENPPAAPALPIAAPVVAPVPNPAPTVVPEANAPINSANPINPISPPKQTEEEKEEEVKIISFIEPELIVNSWTMEDIKHLPQWVQEQLPTYRGMEGRVLERIYRQQTAEYKNACREGLNITEKLFRDMERIFNTLDGQRAAGKIFDYIKNVDRFNTKIKESEARWFGVYNRYFKNDVQRILGKSVPELDHEKGTPKALPAAPVVPIATSPVVEPEGSPIVESKPAENVADIAQQIVNPSNSSNITEPTNAPTPVETTKTPTENSNPPQTIAPIPPPAPLRTEEEILRNSFENILKEYPKAKNGISPEVINFVIKTELEHPYRGVLRDNPKEGKEAQETERLKRMLENYETSKNPQKLNKDFLDNIKEQKENTQQEQQSIIPPTNSPQNLEPKEPTAKKEEYLFVQPPSHEEIEHAFSATKNELGKAKEVELFDILNINKKAISAKKLMNSNRIVLHDPETQTYKLMKNMKDKIQEGQIVYLLKEPAKPTDYFEKSQPKPEIPTKAKKESFFDKANELVKQSFIEYKSNNKGAAISLLTQASQYYEEAEEMELSIQTFNQARKLLEKK